MAFRGEKGNFTIFAILALVAGGLVGGMYYYAASFSGSATRAARPQDMFDRLREDAEKALNSPDALSASLPRNANAFSCLYSALGDCAGKGTNFILFDSGEINAQALSQLGRDTGLNADGIGCRGYPSEQCSLRVEASWEPACPAGPRCENTKSMNVKVRVTFNDGVTKSPLAWEKKGFFSPLIQLSKNVICERDGGVWANTECLTREQASERRIASARSPRVAAQEAAQAAAAVVPESHDQYICPNQIIVQGLYYPVDFISAGKGQVKVPAMNGCQAEDTFVFQCNKKEEPTQFDGEGQWVQIEAIMAGNDCQGGVSANGQESTGYERR